LPLRAAITRGLVVILAGLALASCRAAVRDAGGGAEATLAPSVAPQPTTELSPTATPPASRPRLVAPQVDTAPLLDGRLDACWEAAGELRLPLTWGMHGSDPAYDVAMRALLADGIVYFWVDWPGAGPQAGAPDTTVNRLTMHFDIPAADPTARDVECLVACHTAFTDSRGQLVHLLAETIPPGRTDPLPAAGGWSGGRWRLEWARPLVSANGFDVQFTGGHGSFPFFVKVFEGQQGRPDPVSGLADLVVAP